MCSIGITHQHDKAYSFNYNASYPLQRPWICRICGEHGADSVDDGDMSDAEYLRLCISQRED